jgi:purine nucleosidase
MSTPILLDCDPGIDDALAIAFAHGHPAIELAGITTVAGNVGLARTTRNALAVADFVGATAVPVAAGCAAPLLRPALDASRVHGESGLGGAVLPDSARRPEGEHAADFLIRMLGSAPGEITLVATGPLTNVAMAVRKEPRITQWAREFVIMGGSAGRGNTTPAAEFNIWADPEAAAMVFGAGWTVRMIGLDVTLRALATAEVRGRMGVLGGLARTLLLPALADYREHQKDPAVHDVCAVASVAVPEVFGYTPARVDVETTGRLTSGMTVTDFRASEPNAAVATDIHADAFWDLVLQAYQNVADGIGA